ncbi:TIGR02391 family protein [Burkholderia seminalis]|uniref:TIGR02391 family protein n=1 Tax=Burkholderia seminalis TaxID=488731 RepID=UPI000F597D3F|nr:TIGR02391 family protein [Burkholderia seminalis]RQS98653.1 TIGR02391 family protein [Burkholderia seminalis]
MTVRTLSREQTRRGIEKLKRRIRELDAIDPSSITEGDDPSIMALEGKIQQTLSELLTSSEWQRFRPLALIDAEFHMKYNRDRRDLAHSLAKNIDRARTNLNTIIDLFDERLQDGDDSPEERAQRVFGAVNWHSQIALHCAKLFEHGHYAEAVETACKVLELLVKTRALKDDGSGTGLMQAVFNANKPILKFNDQQTESERSEQTGMMYLYAGAMAAIRNPRAHGVMKDHPEQALEYLLFINMLAKALERTSVV